jgi:hypothetical protein
MSSGLSHRLCSSQWHCPHLTFQGHPRTIHHSTGFVSFVFPPQAPPPPPPAPVSTPKHLSPTHSATTQYSKWSRHSTLVHPQRLPRGWMQLLSSSPQRGLNLKNSLGLRPPQSFVTLKSLQPNHQLLVGPGRLGLSRSRCHVCIPTTHRSPLRRMLQTLRYLVFGISLWSTSSPQRFRTLPHLGPSCIRPSQSGGVHLGVPLQSGVLPCVFMWLVGRYVADALSCQVAELPSCRVAELPSFRVAEVWFVFRSVVPMCSLPSRCLLSLLPSPALCFKYALLLPLVVSFLV